MADLAALAAPTAALASYLAEAQAYVRKAKAANTVKAYQSDWARFTGFCQGREVASLPAAPATVAAYAADAARTLKANTVERHLTAISQAHQMAGQPNPTEDKLVRTVMAGIRRVKGTAQRGKDPLSPDLLRRMLEHAAPGPRGLRDRALLLVGFAGAFRRTELVNLRIEDVRETEEGLIVTIPHSKTDPEGRGQTVGIPYGSHPETCPVRALRTWLECANIRTGFLFPALGRWEQRAVAGPECEEGGEEAGGRFAANPSNFAEERRAVGPAYEGDAGLKSNTRNTQPPGGPHASPGLNGRAEANSAGGEDYGAGPAGESSAATAQASSFGARLRAAEAANAATGTPATGAEPIGEQQHAEPGAGAARVGVSAPGWIAAAEFAASGEHSATPPSLAATEPDGHAPGSSTAADPHISPNQSPSAEPEAYRPLSDHQLAKIIKRLAARAGLDPAAFSGHSLRSGLATAAAEGGATERAIMEQTRHRSLKQVRKYIRRGNLFKDNAAAHCGL